MKRICRRSFLKQTGALAAGGALWQWPGPGFTQVAGATAPFGDYRALVCVFMLGGNDSYNMLVPRSPAEYAVYAESRQNMAIERDALLPVTPATPTGVDYALHPALTGLQGLFDAGKAAFVCNVGPLVEPTTKSQYFDGSVTLPPQLFSHNDQQNQWNSLRGIATENTGWAGRIADLIRLNVANQRLATNISLSGNSDLQSADETVAYVMGGSGPQTFSAFRTPADLDDPSLTDEERARIELFIRQRALFEDVINQPYGTIYERGFAEVQRRAIAAADLVASALRDAPELATPFPQTELGEQLKTVARMIAVRDSLEMERQIFFVATGGFDTHDNQQILQPGLLANVSDSMTAFYTALSGELGVADRVTTFTQSDFARTLTSNGDGTDHAWGAIQCVVGDAVLGGGLYGTYPDLALDVSPDDVGGGRMIPTTSADQYAATLARWFGIDDANLPVVAPHIDNFAIRDLGFLA